MAIAKGGSVRVEFQSASALASRRSKRFLTLLNALMFQSASALASRRCKQTSDPNQIEMFQSASALASRRCDHARRHCLDPLFQSASALASRRFLGDRLPSTMSRFNPRLLSRADDAPAVGGSRNTVVSIRVCSREQTIRVRG